jgi:hypothetical protein
MATTTPNIGLQIPAFNQANWQVPTNFNWTLIDNICGGLVTIPALSVTTLTVGNLNIASLLVANEVPAGPVPGTIYTMAHGIGAMVGLYYNGAILRLNIDYTLSGSVATLNFVTVAGSTLYAVYLRSS